MIGVIVAVIFVMMILFYVVVGIGAGVAVHDRNTKDKINTQKLNELNSYEKLPGAEFDYKCHSYSHIIVTPMKNGDLYITDTVDNKQVIIKKGTVTSFHTEVNGVVTKVTGAYAFGVGKARSKNSADSVNVIINLNDIANPYINIRVASFINMPNGSMPHDLQNFLGRFEAVLNLYMAQ